MAEYVTLRTGRRVLASALGTTAMILDDMWITDPVAVFELVYACRDSSHVLWGNTGVRLKRNELITEVLSDGTARVHDYVRDIVLASTEDAGPDDVRMISPLAGS